MNNIKTIIIGAATIYACSAAAQQERINNYRVDDEKGLIETIAKVEKKTDKFNLYLNMHGDFDMFWNGSHFNEGKFQMQQLRIEAKGNITDWLSYRYRQRLNKGDNPNGYRDNLLNSIDIAGIGINLDKWSFFLGKQCASYGGIEFDLNPIEIYQYSDMVDYMSNFMSGVNVAYNFTPKQQLQFQVLNAINEKSFDKYGGWEKSKLPLVYTLNWNGNFNNFYKTRWSASVMNEVKDKYMYYFALGNEFSFTEKFGAYFDWMYSIEGVDRKGIITDIIGRGIDDRMASRADYMSFVLHLNYRFHPAWNIFLKGMYETAGIYKTHNRENPSDSKYDSQFSHSEEVHAGNYRTTWSYIGGIEYYPFKDRNLHFFATYIGQAHRYSTRALSFGKDNDNTNRLSLGFIWQMPVF